MYQVKNKQIKSEEGKKKPMHDFEKYTGIIRQEEYAKRMEEEVLPYLKAWEREAWIPCIKDNRRRIHVKRYLQEKPRGVVIICHGFSESAQKYPELIYYFLKENYHVYIPEHCGHGLSYRLSEDPSLVHLDHWSRYSRDFLRISRLVRKAHPGLPLYVFAHSMGGAVAAIAAARDPYMYKKVILSSPMIRPLTGNVPYPAAVRVARAACQAGRSMKYAAGQKPYDGKEKFESSSGLSRPRFDRYKKIRMENPAFQTWSPSYGWVYNAAKMNWYLQRWGYGEIQAPILLFQAETDHLVSNKAQDIFAEKINHHGKTSCRLIHMPGTKHEIFNSPDEILEDYWGRVFGFLKGSEKK